MTEEPEAKPDPTKTNPAVVTPITSDLEAAELGVPSEATYGTTYGGSSGGYTSQGSSSPDYDSMKTVEYSAEAPNEASPQATTEVKPPAKFPMATMLGIASFLTVLASAHRLDSDSASAVVSTASGVGSTSGEDIWGIVVGSVSLFFLLMRAIILYVKIVQQTTRLWYTRVAMGWLLVLMWFFAAILLTFVGPFLVTGNGYFAAWAGAICSVALLLQETSAPFE